MLQLNSTAKPNKHSLRELQAEEESCRWSWKWRGKEEEEAEAEDDQHTYHICSSQKSEMCSARRTSSSVSFSAMAWRTEEGTKPNSILRRLLSIPRLLVTCPHVRSHSVFESPVWWRFCKHWRGRRWIMQQQKQQEKQMLRWLIFKGKTRKKMCSLCPLNTDQSHKAYCTWSFSCV